MTKALALVAIMGISTALMMTNYWFVFGIWPHWKAAAIVWPLQIVWGLITTHWARTINKPGPS